MHVSPGHDSVMGTLQASKALQGAGFDESQAEALVNTIGQAVNDTIATKTDIAELRAEIDKARTELRADLDKMRAEWRADIQGYGLNSTGP